MNRRIVWSLAVVFASGAAAMAGDESQAVGKKVADFTLKDYRGKDHSLSDHKDAKLVVLAVLGTECPLAKLYAPRLAELAEEYQSKGVAFLAIAPNRQDSVTELAAYARQHGIKFPVLKDLGNQVADRIGATRTPEVFLLDADRVVRYHGRIDDQYGLKTTGSYVKTKVTRRDLAMAMDELLAGKDVSVPESPVVGCLIGRVREPKQDAKVTYSNQIARILQNQCVDCHRPGEIAPFSFASYDEVVGWADMIAEVVREQRMPPWHADPKYGHWRNDRKLTDEEKEQIFAWVAAGAPEGDPSDLPPPKQYTKGWSIPEPDTVVYITEKPVAIPAEGTIEYKYFTVDPGFTEDKWVRFADCRPGNPSVVHHIICFVQEPGVKSAFTGNEPVNVWLLHGFAPGMPALEFPEDTAFFLPAGSKLVFQMHYTANGTSTEDRSAFGMVFADPKKVRHNARTENAINPYLVIPPGASNHPIEAFHRFSRDSMLLSLMPHMHLRGKAFRYDLEYPDGTVETILDVPRYDFNWQNMYYFAEPKRVPAGTRMHCVAHYDNSEENLANPDPSARVKWGDQTWEEMMIGWFTATTDVEPPSDPALMRSVRFEKECESEFAKVKARALRGAKRALLTPLRFSTFTTFLSKTVPQLDRIDVAVVDGGEVKFLAVKQTPVFNVSIGKEDKTFPASGSALAAIASGQTPVVHPNLAERDEADLGLFKEVVRSGYHVPVSIKGKPGVISFYSREPDAFGPSARKILEEVAGQLAGD